MDKIDIESLFRQFKPERKRIVILKKDVQHTRNLFGTIDDLRKGILWLHEQNPEGYCLCLFNNEYLVDVNHRDIQEIV